VDDTFASASATKKPRPPSTRSDTQAIGSMLLDEHINVLYFPFIVYMFPYSSTFFSSDSSAVEILEDEDEDDSATLVTRW
jgi:hypothetical protein